MSKIFISYRRDDSGDAIGRIYDHLIPPFGPFSEESIFKDVDSMPLGINFEEFIAQKTGECSVALVVIGPDWLNISDKDNQRRLDDAEDYVRIEVETLLKRNIPVIPLLVRKASMPKKGELPPSIADITIQNGMPIRYDPDFKVDMKRLIKSVQAWMDGITKINDKHPNVAEEQELIPTEEISTSDTGPYDKLAQWLASNIENEVTLTFQEIESIMERELPPSAQQKSWWANDSVGHVQSKRWLDAGWRTKKLNLSNQTITFSRIVERQLAYIEFFSDVIQELKSYSLVPTKRESPTGDSWHSLIPFSIGGAQLASINLAFTLNKRFRIELYIDTGNKESNKAIYDELWKEHTDLDMHLGLELTGERIDNKRASRIALYYPDNISIISPIEELEQLQNWIVTNTVRFNNVLSPKLMKVLHKIM